MHDLSVTNIPKDPQLTNLLDSIKEILGNVEVVILYKPVREVGTENILNLGKSDSEVKARFESYYKRNIIADPIPEVFRVLYPEIQELESFNRLMYQLKEYKQGVDLAVDESALVGDIRSMLERKDYSVCHKILDKASFQLFLLSIWRYLTDTDSVYDYLEILHRKGWLPLEGVLCEPNVQVSLGPHILTYNPDLILILYDGHLSNYYRKLQGHQTLNTEFLEVLVRNGNFLIMESSIHPYYHSDKIVRFFLPKERIVVEEVKTSKEPILDVLEYDNPIHLNSFASIQFQAARLEVLDLRCFFIFRLNDGDVERIETRSGSELLDKILTKVYGLKGDEIPLSKVESVDKYLKGPFVIKIGDIRFRVSGVVCEGNYLIPIFESKSRYKKRENDLILSILFRLLYALRFEPSLIPRVPGFVVIREGEPSKYVPLW